MRMPGRLVAKPDGATNHWSRRDTKCWCFFNFIIRIIHFAWLVTDCTSTATTRNNPRTRDLQPSNISNAFHRVQQNQTWLELNVKVYFRISTCQSPDVGGFWFFSTRKKNWYFVACTASWVCSHDRNVWRRYKLWRCRFVHWKWKDPDNTAIFVDFLYWENYMDFILSQTYWVADNSTLSSKQWRTQWIRYTTNVKRSFMRQVRRTAHDGTNYVPSFQFESRQLLLANFLLLLFLLWVSSFSSSNSLNDFLKKRLCDECVWVMNGCWQNANLNFEESEQKNRSSLFVNLNMYMANGIGVWIDARAVHCGLFFWFYLYLCRANIFRAI